MGVADRSLFQKLHAIRWLNMAAFTFTLSAFVGVAFSPHRVNVVGGEFPLACSVATLFVGPLWAHTLRKYPVAWTGSPRVGRALAILLAMGNGALAGIFVGVLDASNLRDLVIGSGVGGMLGATFGALFWIPTLFATLVLFGLPTAWASALAKRGLRGEERGEMIVGALSCLTSAALFALTFLLPPHQRSDSFAGDSFYTETPVWMLRAFASAAVLLGAFSATFARKRDRLRQAFVADAASGKIPGFRVDATRAGNVLVRYERSLSAYRGSDVEEEVFAIDELAARAP